MSAGFGVLCLIASVIPLGILYFLMGPTRGKPLTVVPRASMVAIPRPPRAARAYEPERVYASEHKLMITSASVVRVPPIRGTTVPPLPRARSPRGSSAPTPTPAIVRDTARNELVRPFTDDDPTLFSDERD